MTNLFGSLPRNVFGSLFKKNLFGSLLRKYLWKSFWIVSLGVSCPTYLQNHLFVYINSFLQMYYMQNTSFSDWSQHVQNGKTNQPNRPPTQSFAKRGQNVKIQMVCFREKKEQKSLQEHKKPNNYKTQQKNKNKK